MATFSVRLDGRYRNAKNESSIMFFITKGKAKATISIGIYATKDILTNDVCRMIKETVPHARKINNEIYTLFLKYNFYTRRT